MKEIPLTKGFVALVDDEDYELLSQVEWHWEAGYAKAEAQSDSYRRAFPHYLVSTQGVFMHRLLLQAPRGLEGDHRSRNTLDNRKSNLRLATKGQNQQNAASFTGASQYKGVHWHKANLRWAAQITSNGIREFLGMYLDEKCAALAYDRAAHQRNGEFARLNFPDDPQHLLPFTLPSYPGAATYFKIYPSGSRFVCRVRGEHLGSFESAYDAALYRDHHIEKHNLTDRMNFS